MKFVECAHLDMWGLGRCHTECNISVSKRFNLLWHWIRSQPGNQGWYAWRSYWRPPRGINWTPTEIPQSQKFLNLMQKQFSPGIVQILSLTTRWCVFWATEYFSSNQKTWSWKWWWEEGRVRLCFPTGSRAQAGHNGQVEVSCCSWQWSGQQGVPSVPLTHTYL